MVKFGKQTYVKLLGGQLIARQTGQTNEEMVSGYREVGRRLRDASVPFNQWIPHWFRQERLIFRSQGLPRWDPLKPKYKRWKAIHYGNKGILRREDRLWNSLTRRTRDTHIRVGPRSLQLGTKVPYSKYLQRDRPHVVLMPATFQLLSEITLAHILQPVGGSRRRPRR